MKIYFITGGFGFLGQYIVNAIHEHDLEAELRVLGRTQRKTFLGVEKLDRVRWIQGDLSKPETFEKELEGVDVIIHNAAMVSFSKSDADAIYEANVIGTRNLANAALEAGIGNFIFISSISAVGRNPGGLIDETYYPDLEKKRRRDMYGYSKVISETDLAKLKDKMRVIILNPSVILGPGSPRVESFFRKLSLFPLLPMLSYINSFVDARDVAQAVILSLSKGRSGERYIVTAHNENMIDFIKKAMKIMGARTRVYKISDTGIHVLDGIIYFMRKIKLKISLRPLSEIAEDKAFSWEKIKKEMGWEPHYEVEQSLEEAIGRKR